MQFAIAAVIVEAVGEIRKLLDFAQRKPAAERVYGAGGDEKGIARPNLHPVQKIQYVRLTRGGRKFVARNSAAQADRDLRSFIGPENVPHLCFAEATVVQ